MKKLSKSIGIFILCLLLGAGFFCTEENMQTVYAYTEEEKEAVKAWLSANGYPPTMEGAQQAYQDYLDGKLGPVDGDGGSTGNGSPQTTESNPQSEENTDDTLQTESAEETGEQEASTFETETEVTESMYEQEAESVSKAAPETAEESAAEPKTEEKPEDDKEIETNSEEQTSSLKKTESEFSSASETGAEGNVREAQDSKKVNIVVLLSAVVGIAAICFIIYYCRSKKGR